MLQVVNSTEVTTGHKFKEAGANRYEVSRAGDESRLQKGESEASFRHVACSMC